MLLGLGFRVQDLGAWGLGDRGFNRVGFCSIPAIGA